MRKNTYIVLGTLATIVVALALYTQLIGKAQDNVDEVDTPGRFCAQVITPARNIETGEIKDFPSSCIPDGWERIAPVPIQMEEKKEPISPKNEGELVCAQVITPARNIETGEVKEFPNSCIPDGWERIEPEEIEG